MNRDPRIDAEIRDIFRREGGYVNHPDDRGGPTNRGITLAQYRRFKDNPSFGADDVKAITEAESFDFYYWYFGQRDMMGYPPEMFPLLLDLNTLHSPGGVRTILDGVAKFYDPDGDTKETFKTMVAQFGPVTTNALVSLRRVGYFRALVNRNRSQDAFLRGWLNRNKDFEPDWE